MHQLLRVLVYGTLLTTLLAADNPSTIGSFRVENGVAIVDFADDPGKYFLLEYSEDLINWVAADMTLGEPSRLEIVPGVQKGFFRAIPYGKHAPLDSDGDGIDDVYELNHPHLNPLDPTDGPKFALGGGGLTNYQVYLNLFRITNYRILQRESREVSVFNFGSPSATFEANSREQSVFNFGSPSATIEANSREISLYNGQYVPYSDLAQIETREVSVFNFGSNPGSTPGGPPALAEVITKEVSVYNGQHVPYSDLAQIESREVSVFNFGSPSAPLEAISREVSVLNFEEP
jgi:hypothetical protein